MYQNSTSARIDAVEFEELDAIPEEFGFVGTAWQPAGSWA